MATLRRFLPYIVAALIIGAFAIPLIGTLNRGAKVAAPAAGPGPSAPVALRDEHNAAAGGPEAIRKAAGVDNTRLQNADQEPGNWLSYGRTYDEQRFSPLDQINETTAKDLGLAWSYATGTIRGLEATPLVVDGVMYVSGSWSRVYAIEAKTGRELWTFDPEVPGEWARKACCDVVNRGVAVWQGRVYVGTLDGRLVALDAGSGEVLWDVNTIDRSKAYTITGAPRVVKGKVIIGNGGADLGVRGYVTAYDAKTGREIWRFYTVPGNPALPQESAALEAALKTWDASGTRYKWWEIGGGGTAWDAMAYDPTLDLLYVGTGNASPWNRYVRSDGDNLYVSSILALRPDTGELVWYYQTTPGDSWDFTATQHLMLADLTIDGVARKVIMQAPKNGFFYVLDRETGKLISAEKYTNVTWAERIDKDTGRPVENTSLNFERSPKTVLPPPLGGHNWQPMAFDPKTGLVYIPVHEYPQIFITEQGFKARPNMFNSGLDFAALARMTEGLPGSATGALRAWDPVSQSLRWEIKHDTYWNGGLLATAGNLVFQGTASGRFFAAKADTGAIVWETNVKGGIIAAPMTYRVDGEQYVAILVGWGGASNGTLPDMKSAVFKYGNDGRILAFKLGAKLPIDVPTVERGPIPEPPAVNADPITLSYGKDAYHRNCGICHGFFAQSAGIIPDLRYMTPEVRGEFRDIVLNGTRAAQGMASFRDVVDEQTVDAIYAYVTTVARQAYDAEKAQMAAKPQ